MNYKLPDFDLTPFPKVYAGDRLRYATATATSFVDDNKILVASFLNKKIYLVDISNGFIILDEISTENYPDLMDYKDGMIVVSNRAVNDTKAVGVSIFKLENDKLHFVKSSVISNFKQLHGCRILNESKIIVTETTDKWRGVYIFNIETGEFEKFNDFEYFPKDVYLYDDKIIVITSHSRPSGVEKVVITNSFIYLFEFPSFKKIDELFFYGQTDAVTFKDGIGFITLQGQDSLLCFKINNNKIENIKNINGFNFPHGVDYNGEKVVITNYGDNSVDIIPVSDL